MSNLYWVYFPDHFPDDVLLLNLESATSWSLRIYEEPDRPPRKLGLSDIDVLSAKNVLSAAAWREPVEQPGINIDTRPEWWKGRARTALRHARGALSD
jgi:hypothetical protein